MGSREARSRGLRRCDGAPEGAALSQESAPGPRCAARRAVPLSSKERGKAKLGRASRREINAARRRPGRASQRVRAKRGPMTSSAARPGTVFHNFIRSRRSAFGLGRACRRAGDVFPACLLPILHEVNTSITAFAAAPGRPPRVQTDEDTLSAQIQRLNKRLAHMLEAQVGEFERKVERRRAG